MPTFNHDTVTPLPTPTIDLTGTAQASESLALVMRNGQFVIVRTAPTVNSSVATLTPPGVTVTILQKAPGDIAHPNVPWYYVRLADGTRGWMRSDMLDIFWPPPATGTPRKSSSPPPSVSWKTGIRLEVNNPNGVWLRHSPASGAAQVATLAFHNFVTTTGNKHFDGGRWWWEVRAEWGAVGWVEQVSLVPA